MIFIKTKIFLKKNLKIIHLINEKHNYYTDQKFTHSFSKNEKKNRKRKSPYMKILCIPNQIYALNVGIIFSVIDYLLNSFQHICGTLKEFRHLWAVVKGTIFLIFFNNIFYHVSIFVQNKFWNAMYMISNWILKCVKVFW